MYAGIDAHKRDRHATVLNCVGETVSTARFPTNPKALTQWSERLPSGHYGWVVESPPAEPSEVKQARRHPRSRCRRPIRRVSCEIPVSTRVQV